jgi:hypothetical protein
MKDGMNMKLSKSTLNIAPCVMVGVNICMRYIVVKAPLMHYRIIINILMVDARVAMINISFIDGQPKK